MRFTALRFRRRAEPSPAPGKFLRTIAARLGLLACLSAITLPIPAGPALAATPPDAASAAPRTDAQPVRPTPPERPTPPAAAARGRHARYIVEVNAKGQVSKVRFRARSRDPRFDAITYGNVVQIFVRRSDGRAIAGVYRVSYDYNPKTQLVQRHVRLIRSGGVDSSALGLVDVYKELNREHYAQMKASLGNVHLVTPAPTKEP